MNPLRNAALCLILCGVLASCGSSGGGNGGGGGGNGGGGGGTTDVGSGIFCPIDNFPQPPPGSAFLTSSDVKLLVQTAVTTGNSDSLTVAVVDRLGVILAVWQGPNAPTISPGNLGNMVNTRELAVSLARTAAFFSNDQAPLSSRTVRFISGIHFPPGIPNTPNADLYGIENTNRGCTLSTSYLAGKQIPLPTNDLGIITGKADINDRAGDDLKAIGDVNPGGVPIFKKDPATGGVHAVGGIGVAGVKSDVAEYIAFQAAGLMPLQGVQPDNTDGIALPLPLPFPGAVVIGGIAVPFVDQITAPADLTTAGTFSTLCYKVSRQSSNGPPPDGWLVGPNSGSMLTAAQVTSMVTNAVGAACQTRRDSLHLDNLARREIRPALKAAGIPWHGWYALRRGVATMLSAVEKDPMAAKGLLRHTSVVTTQKHYIKEVPAVTLAAMQKIEVLCNDHATQDPVLPA